MSENDQAATPPMVDPATTAHLPAINDFGGESPPSVPGTPGSAIDALPPSSALLVVQHGPNTGARFLLDADVTTAGRDTASEIFLDDVTVSRKHAEFRRTAEGFDVRDLGSLNGTYVNRERIDSAVLAPGDEVQVGKYRLTFHPSPRRPEESG